MNWCHFLFFSQKKLENLPFSKKIGRLPFFEKLWSSSIFWKIKVVFHFQINLGCLPIWSYSSTVWLLSRVLNNFQLFTTIPDGRAGGRPGGRVLEETKLRLTQPSLVGLGLWLSKTNQAHMCEGRCNDYCGSWHHSFNAKVNLFFLLYLMPDAHFSG